MESTETTARLGDATNRVLHLPCRPAILAQTVSAEGKTTFKLTHYRQSV